MKFLYLTILLIFVNLNKCYTQTNELTQAEFNSIKFDNVSLSDLFEADASINRLRSLFDNDLVEAMNETAPVLSKDVFNDKIYLNYENVSVLDSQYQLTNIQITNPSITVQVKDLIVNIGDNINVLENDFNIIYQNDFNSLVFIDQLTGTGALIFKINKLTNQITEIEFIAY